ncbi:MAG: polysaccharide biosynthesis/export family protein [Planctomycetota bacterium]|jgi:polysaccharide export outer membrane protein
MRKLAALILFLPAVLGCASQLDFGIDGVPLDKSMVDPGVAESRARLRDEQLARALAAWRLQRRVQAPDYLVGPGDLLEISVFGLEDPERASAFTRTVGQDGIVTLPWSDPIEAWGLSVGELEERIGGVYSGRYLKEPQVTARVLEYHGTAVVVTGAVNTPGIYYLTANRSTVLEMLALAGGLAREAGDELVLVRGKPGLPGRARVSPTAATNTVRIDLRELVANANLSLNVQVGDGDIVTVPTRAEEYVYVLGYVRRPGAYRLEPGMRIDAVRAMALGGGLMTTARAANSYLVREVAGEQKVFDVDLSETGEVYPVYMQPGDVLVVGSSTPARISEVLRPSMGASVSASASVVP